MADSFIVCINLEQVRSNFNRVDKKHWTTEEVTACLKESGFVERPEGWLCEELTLDLLDKTEYRIIAEY
jgi:hypothetical protein